MNDLTDDQLATLLTQSMQAHDADVDPERARLLARAVEPTPRRWGPALLVAAAVTAVVVGIGGYVAVQHGDPNSTAAGPESTKPPPSSNGQPTYHPGGPSRFQLNIAMAAAASQRAVDSLPLPAGTDRIGGKPAGWPESSMGLAPADSRLGREAWWSTPLTKDQLAHFLTVNAPPGMRHTPGDDPINDGSSDGLAYTEYDLTKPPAPYAFLGPTLIVEFTRIGDRTFMHAETFAAARYPVSSQHRITSPVISVVIHRFHKGTSPNSGSGVLPTVRLTRSGDSKQIDQLVQGFNRLPGTANSNAFMSCPYQGIWTDTVAFTTGSGSRTVATLKRSGCADQVVVRVDGRRLITTLDPGSWDTLVNRIANAAG